MIQSTDQTSCLCSGHHRRMRAQVLREAVSLQPLVQQHHNHQTMHEHLPYHMPLPPYQARRKPHSRQSFSWLSQALSLLNYSTVSSTYSRSLLSTLSQRSINSDTWASSMYLYIKSGQQDLLYTAQGGSRAGQNPHSHCTMFTTGGSSSGLREHGPSPAGPSPKTTGIALPAESPLKAGANKLVGSCCGGPCVTLHHYPRNDAEFWIP